jgi:hypothetical protein
MATEQSVLRIRISAKTIFWIRDPASESGSGNNELKKKNKLCRKPKFTMMGEVLSGKLESTFEVYFKYFRRDFVLFGELSLF